MSESFEIKHATVSDVPLILSFIKELAGFLIGMKQPLLFTKN